MDMDEVWIRQHRTPTAARCKLASLRGAARRYLQERGRRARREDVDELLLTFWWRLPDDVHDLLGDRERSRRPRSAQAGRGAMRCASS